MLEQSTFHTKTDLSHTITLAKRSQIMTLLLSQNKNIATQLSSLAEKRQQMTEDIEVIIKRLRQAYPVKHKNVLAFLEVIENDFRKTLDDTNIKLFYNQQFHELNIGINIEEFAKKYDTDLNDISEFTVSDDNYTYSLYFEVYEDDTISTLELYYR